MDVETIPGTMDVETIPGGLKVCDANGQSLADVYSRENPNDAHKAKVLNEDVGDSYAKLQSPPPSIFAIRWVSIGALFSCGAPGSASLTWTMPMSFLNCALLCATL